jgi:hypothetical protein
MPDGLSPEGFILHAEMLANNEINLDRIIAHVQGDPLSVQPDPPRDQMSTCFWCEMPIPTPQDAFLDEVLTGLFGYWYCSKQCRNHHIASK